MGQKECPAGRRLHAIRAAKARFSSPREFRFSLAFLFLTVLSFSFPTATRAADPPTGTITPTSANVTWRGTATGTTTGDPLGGEASCQEGVSCDTFTLTVSGTPA